MGPDLIAAPRPQPASLEEALREVVANAPYLAIALLVHLAVLLVFWNMELPPEVLETEKVISGHLEDPVEALVEPPPQPIEQTFDTPVVSETPVFDEVPIPDDLPPVDSALNADMGLAFDSGPASILGPGGGPPEGGGIGGRGRQPTGTPTAGHVRNGLLWLAAHQDPAGHWSAADFDEQCGRQGDDGPCDGRGLPRHDVGVTGLSLLAFLGAGHTDRHGEFRVVVKDGLRFLRDIQGADGRLSTAPGSHGTYDHIIATLALCEAYHYGRSRHLRPLCEKALGYMAGLRAPASGWRYGPDHSSASLPDQAADTSVTGWALLTLATAAKAGLPVDEDALADGLAFLDEMTDRDTGRTGYIERGGGSAREVGTEGAWPVEQSEAMTAVAVLCRVFADPELSTPGQRELVERGAELLEALPPTWDDPGRRDFYYWYYGAYALYQVGGAGWKTWERAIRETLMEHQRREGELKGSWDPQGDPWGHAGGRVYTTALNTLTLEVYFRYDTLLGG